MCFGSARCSLRVESHDQVEAGSSQSAGRPVIAVRLGRRLADDLHRQLPMAEASAQCPHVILLVDDELRTTRRMADMLREDGFAVEIAHDGAAAIAYLSRSPVPDALVTELTTAYADGLAIGRFARNQRPGMPVFVLTGYPNLFHANAFGDGPPAILFTKPVEYAALRSALRDAVEPSAASERCAPSPAKT